MTFEEIESGSEDTNSVASEGATSDTSSPSPESGSPAQAAAPKADTTPFHEHPRFKELVEQKNEALKRYQDMESRYKTIEQQVSSLKESQPKAPTEFDQLIQDLKKVDPRLAGALEAQAKSMEQSKALQARLEAFERQSEESKLQATIQTAVSKINSLHESNKMSDFGKQFINNQLDIAYRTGQLQAGDLKSVEAAYQKSAAAIKAYEDNLSRTLRESYVKDKTKDAAVPASLPKGTQAKPAQQTTPKPRDKDDLRAQVVKSYLKDAAASKAATNT